MPTSSPSADLVARIGCPKEDYEALLPKVQAMLHEIEDNNGSKTLRSGLTTSHRDLGSQDYWVLRVITSWKLPVDWQVVIVNIMCENLALEHRPFVSIQFITGDPNKFKLSYPNTRPRSGGGLYC
jgi:hypothetical protein